MKFESKHGNLLSRQESALENIASKVAAILIKHHCEIRHDANVCHSPIKVRLYGRALAASYDGNFMTRHRIDIYLDILADMAGHRQVMVFDNIDRILKIFCQTFQTENMCFD